jgi:hypothetical protein
VTQVSQGRPVAFPPRARDDRDSTPLIGPLERLFDAVRGRVSRADRDVRPGGLDLGRVPLVVPASCTSAEDGDDGPDDDGQARARERYHELQVAHVARPSIHLSALAPRLSSGTWSCWQRTPADSFVASWPASHTGGKGESMGRPSAEQSQVALGGLRAPNASEGNRGDQ